MTDFHQNQIIKFYEDLVTYMSVDGVIVRFIPSHLLTFGEVEEITKHGERAKQVEALLKTLLRKPDRAFDKLVDALRSTKQGHLANLLIGEGKHSVFT